jgi:hypothetical protein
MSKSNT